MYYRNAVIAGAFSLLLWSTAWADTSGTIGVIAHVTIYSENSDLYGTRHGEMLVDEGGGETQLYTWGGSKCSNKDLTEAQVAALTDKVANKRYLVAPNWVAGAGGTRCLVSFTLTSKKYGKLLQE